MNTKAFLLLLLGFLLVGGAIGGAFSGGVALGKSSQKETAQQVLNLPTPTVSQARQTPSGGAVQDQLQVLRQRLQSGELSSEQLQQLQQELRDRLGSVGTGPAAGGGGLFGQGGAAGSGFGFGLSGTIDKVEGSTVTINTPQGPLRATLGPDTAVQKFTVGGIADLTVGTSVRVTGQRGDGGVIQAQSVQIVPADQAELFGGGRGAVPGGRTQR